jgi:hypothetical protein
MKETKVPVQRESVIAEEINNLLQKNAIEPVPPSQLIKGWPIGPLGFIGQRYRSFML